MAASSTRAAQGALWAAHIRREFDMLIRALDGVGASSLVQQLATEAVVADNGTLKTSVGEAGYSWDPATQERKKARDPVGQRIAAAGASLGRVLAGAQCDHRAYLAFLEAIYQVSTNQDRDVTARIEALWAMADQLAEEERVEEERKAEHRGLLGRAWDAIVNWWRHGWAA